MKSGDEIENGELALEIKKQTVTQFDRDIWFLLGLPFDAVSIEEAAQIIADAIENKQFCFLSTPNVNFVINALRDDAFYHSVVNSGLSIADGMPLIWLAKILGIPLSERVAGSDVFDYLNSHQLTEKKIRVFFFGGQEGIAEEAHKKLNQHTGSLISCGYYDPGFVGLDDMSRPEVLDAINASEPDFILVALGAKKGQTWIQHNRDKLNAPVISHLGAVINFVAGTVERAPEFWQRFGLEWLWRIKQEPGLWRRYFYDGITLASEILTKIIPLAVYTRLCHYSAADNQEAGANIRTDILMLHGSFNNKQNDILIPAYKKLVSLDSDIVIDMHDVSYIDAAFIAKTILFQRYLNEQDKRLVLKNVPRRIKRIMFLSGVLSRFRLISDKG